MAINANIKAFTYPRLSLSYRPEVSAPLLILAVVAWIAVVDNQSLWGHLNQRMNIVTLQGIGYILSLFGLMVLLLGTPLFIIGQRWILKPILIALILICGVLAYFSQQLGVVFDIEMVRNVTETLRDGNTQEGVELFSMSLIVSLLLTALAPVALVVRARINYGTMVADHLRRSAWWLGLLCVVASLVLLNYKYVTYFSRENNDLEVYLNPFYPIKTSKQLVKRNYKARHQVFTELGDDAIQVKTATQRTVGVMVVGETARRNNFSLNGYARKTNPELAKRQVINFESATSCGTSTAYSVPCMFSFLDQDSYSPEAASQQSNVLDVLEKAGVKTVWVDSNSSCKGVCQRIENINLLDASDTSSVLYVDGAWHDEVLLSYLDKYLDSSEGDVLLVLHTMGSHGPAYYRRYPVEFAEFKPFCQSKAPQECSVNEIVNAYDNTIRYTDHVLAAIIDKLGARQDSSFMLYASDHGESLGENGIYLHGLPKFMAPAVQSQVPIIGWFSDHFLEARSLPRLPSSVTQIDTAISHDNISSSILGLFNVQSSVYKPDHDLFMQDGVTFQQNTLVQNIAPTAVEKAEAGLIRVQ